MNFNSESTDAKLRIGYIFLASLFVLLGLLMTESQEVSHLFGVRTQLTMSDPDIWRAVNFGAGVAIAAWGWLALVVSPFMTINLAAFVLFSVISTVIVALPALNPQIFIYSGMAVSANNHTNSNNITGLVSALLIFLCVGNILSANTLAINRNSTIGFRFKKLMRSEEIWRKGNRAGGNALQLTAALGIFITLALHFSGHKHEAVGAAIIAILTAPFLAAIRAHSIN